MAAFVLDTTVIVAVLCSWHEHHGRATREIERRVDAGDSLLMAGPALVESYAVLTRLPSPYRLSPANALTLLEANFPEECAHPVVLDSSEYAKLVNGAPSRGIVGGAMHDAVIYACAEAAGAAAVLTFNERHFRRIALAGVNLIVPGD